MKNFFSLVLFSVKENLKTKLYIVLLIFTTVLIFVGLLLTGLSGFEQPQRVLVNTGIAMIEMFCLMLILLNSINLFLQDVETKSIYLVLSKPVSRVKYILSKYVGLLIVIVVNIVIMSTIHVLLVKLSKWSINYGYVLTLVSIFLKTGLITAISLLTAVVMTSQTAAVITSLLLWITGHFTLEFIFIVKKIQFFPIRFFFNVVYYLIPNFQYFNIKDYFDSQYFIQKFNPCIGIFYWLVYISTTLTLTCLVFKQKNL